MKMFEDSIAGVFRRLPHKTGWSPQGVALMAARRMWTSTHGEGTVVVVLDTRVEVAPTAISTWSRLGSTLIPPTREVFM